MIINKMMLKEVKINENIYKMMANNNYKEIRLLIWLLNNNNITYKDFYLIYDRKYNTRSSFIKKNIPILKELYLEDTYVFEDIKMNKSDKTINFIFNKKFLNIYYSKENLVSFQFRKLFNDNVNIYYTFLILILLTSIHKRYVKIDKQQLVNIFFNSSTTIDNKYIDNVIIKRNLPQLQLIFNKLKYKSRYNKQGRLPSYYFSWKDINHDTDKDVIVSNDDKYFNIILMKRIGTENERELQELFTQVENEYNIRILNKNELLDDFIF